MKNEEKEFILGTILKSIPPDLSISDFLKFVTEWVSLIPKEVTWEDYFELLKKINKSDKTLEQISNCLGHN